MVDEYLRTVLQPEDGGNHSESIAESAQVVVVAETDRGEVPHARFEFVKNSAVNCMIELNRVRLPAPRFIFRILGLIVGGELRVLLGPPRQDVVAIVRDVLVGIVDRHQIVKIRIDHVVDVVGRTPNVNQVFVAQFIMNRDDVPCEFAVRQDSPY